MSYMISFCSFYGLLPSSLFIVVELLDDSYHSGPELTRNKNYRALSLTALNNWKLKEAKLRLLHARKHVTL